VIPYRSKKELTGKVRIVTFPGIDICACCGTHVTHTGEIGMVKILSVVKFHEGVRIEMICGVRVLQYLNQIDAQNRSVSVRLSAKPKETAQAVDRLWEENFRLKGKILHMEDELFAREAQAQAGKGNVLLFQSEMEADSVRKLTDAVLQTCNGRCAVFSENADGSFKYAIGEKNGDLRSFTKEMNVALNGRGGGKPFFVQGSVKASKQEIEKYFAER
jgi:alanyl-tRNA synthetase